MDSEQKRIIKAFLIAPLAGPTLFAIGVSVFSTVILIGSGEIKLNQAGGIIVYAPIWFLFGVPVAYATTYILGLPIYLLLRSRLGEKLSVWVLTAAGVGLIAGFVFSLCTGMSQPGWYLGYMLFGGLFGVVTGHAFWRLGIKPPNNKLHMDRAKSARPVS